MRQSIRTDLETNLTNFINGDPGVMQLTNDDTLISKLATRKWRMIFKREGYSGEQGRYEEART